MIDGENSAKETETLVVSPNQVGLIVELFYVLTYTPVVTQ